MVKEYDEVIGNKKGEIELQEVKKLEYTSNVLNETLRLIPPVTGIPKKVEKDVFLNDTFFLPQGTYLNVDVSNLHRNPLYWKDPHSFYPSRFTEHQIHDNAFIPFRFFFFIYFSFFIFIYFFYFTFFLHFFRLIFFF